MQESLVVLLLVGVETEGTLYTVQICLQNIDFITNKQFDQLATSTKYAIIGTFCSLILCIKRTRLKTTVVLLKTNNTWARQRDNHSVLHEQSMMLIEILI
jgi:hypothetical protein